MTKSKRLKLCIYVFHVYIILGGIAFYYSPANIASFGGFLASTSVPVIGYILGESWRPSTSSKQ